MFRLLLKHLQAVYRCVQANCMPNIVRSDISVLYTIFVEFILFWYTILKIVELIQSATTNFISFVNTCYMFRPLSVFNVMYSFFFWHFCM